MASALKRLVTGSPVGLLALRIVDWTSVRRRPAGVHAEDVNQVLAALEAEGLHCWLSGGWGIDALLGRQCRSHEDIDVVLDLFEDAEPRALKALGPLGYRMVERRYTPGLWMPRCSALSAGAGRNIDLVSLDSDLVLKALGAPEGGKGGSPDAMFTSGEISGSKVPCLAAPVQILLHAGYWARSSDRFDMSLLTRRFPDASAATKMDGSRVSKITAGVMRANLDYGARTGADLN